MRRTARRAGGRPERHGRGRGQFRDGQRRVSRRPLDQGRRRRLQARPAGALRPHVRDQPRPDPLRAARHFAVGDAHDAALGRSARRPGQGVAQRPPGRRGAGRGADRRTEGSVRKRQGSADRGERRRRRSRRARFPTGPARDRRSRRARAAGGSLRHQTHSRARPLSQGQRDGPSAARTVAHGRIPRRMRHAARADARRPRPRRRLSRLARRADDRRRRGGDPRAVRIRRRRLRAGDRRRSRRRRRRA